MATPGSRGRRGGRGSCSVNGGGGARGTSETRHCAPTVEGAVGSAAWRGETVPSGQATSPPPWVRGRREIEGFVGRSAGGGECDGAMRRDAARWLGGRRESGFVNDLR